MGGPQGAIQDEAPEGDYYDAAVVPETTTEPAKSIGKKAKLAILGRAASKKVVNGTTKKPERFEDQIFGKGVKITIKEK